MKLYYSPGACSLSPHIVACEAGIDIELCRVDLRNHKLENGTDYTHINPKGYVPALQLEGGELLTEGPAIVQFLAEQKPAAKLAPEYGSLPHYHLLAWLNFIATEVHKVFAPLFWQHSEAEQAAARQKLNQRFGYIEEQLNSNYLLGDQFTVADAYLFTVYNWNSKVEVGTRAWPKLKAFSERMVARPAVQKALRNEGLLDN